MEKLSLLRRHQVRPFLGGQMQEYVLHTMGVEALPEHFQEARAVGFDMIEISTPRVRSTTVQIYAGKKFLVKTCVPDVIFWRWTPRWISDRATGN